jgi:hypothetical protein
MRLTDLELPDDAPQITMQALKSVLRDNSPFYDLLSRTGPEEEK